MEIFLFLAAPILAILLILIKKKFPVIILGILQCGFWFLFTSTFKSQFANYQAEFSYGAGYYVGILGAVLFVVGSVIAFVTKPFKTEKHSIET